MYPEYEELNKCAADAIGRPQASTLENYAQQVYGQMEPNKYRRPTVTEELSKSHADAGERIERSQKALRFLEANPAFDEFITLIRTGCIQI